MRFLRAVRNLRRGPGERRGEGKQISSIERETFRRRKKKKSNIFPIINCLNKKHEETAIFKLRSLKQRLRCFQLP